MKRTLLLALLVVLLSGCAEAALPEAADTDAPSALLAVMEETATPAVAQEQVATATASPETVATLAENTPTPEEVEPTETPTPTVTPEVTATSPVPATAVTEQVSTGESGGRFVFQLASGGDIY
ncbi:MAG TPA: lipoprotein, partial [Anaerolineae bacterium]|nr:lipoprotein [Anaerolineae bacterium]